MQNCRPQIVFVTPHYGRASGGVGVSAERIVRFLGEGHDVDVVVPDRLLALRQVNVRRIPAGKLHGVGGLTKDAGTLQFLTEYIVSKLPKASVVILFYIGREACAGTHAAKILQVPIVACGRGDDVDLLPFTEEGWRIIHLLSSANEVVAVSSEMAGKVRALNDSVQVSVIPNSTDPVLFPYQHDYSISEVQVIGLFGEIKRKKGLDLLLIACRDLSLPLYICGTLREESRKLLQGVCALSPETVELISEFPYTDSLPELIKRYYAVDIVCIPSYFEGMPNVLLEAMSCGKVVVAAAVGGCRDLIEDGVTGYLFDPEDSSSLTEAISRASSELPHRGEELRREARSKIEKVGHWQLEQRRYTDLLQRVLGADLCLIFGGYI